METKAHIHRNKCISQDQQMRLSIFIQILTCSPLLSSWCEHCSLSTLWM